MLSKKQITASNVRKNTKFKANDGLTFTTIPIVIRTKYVTNSNGFLTGVLNLTIDNAPTIPNESAIFEDITDVIKKPTTGKKEKDKR